MQVTDQTIHSIVARMFGPTATVRGSLGTERRPGVLSIEVGGRVVGAGRTLASAVDAATRCLSATANRTCIS